jgi:hypothetical protein
MAANAPVGFGKNVTADAALVQKRKLKMQFIEQHTG